MPREKYTSSWIHDALGKKLHKQLDPRCLGGEITQAAESTIPQEKYTSSWIHDALGEIHKQLDLRCLGEEIT